MSQYAYVLPYVFRSSVDANGKNLTFAGKIVRTTVVLQTGFSASTNGQAGVAFQQNVNASRHWYQNCLIQDSRGGIYWYLENFETNGNLPNGNPAFPLNGQYIRGTTPTDIQIPGTNDITPRLPSSLVPENGGIIIIFETKDNGIDTISQHMRILDTASQSILYDSPWIVVADVSSPNQNVSGHWYDSLTAVAMDIADQGGQETVFSTGTQVLVTHDVDVPDLVFGGTYWLDGVPYVTLAPPVNDGSGESSNITYTLANPNSSSPISQGRDPMTFKVNGYEASVTVTTDGQLNWIASNVTKGALILFGFIPSDKDPAPIGAGFSVASQATADQNGNASGTVQLTPGIYVFDGANFDCYVYDCALASANGYSHPIRVNVSNALIFQGSC